MVEKTLDIKTYVSHRGIADDPISTRVGNALQRQRLSAISLQRDYPGYTFQEVGPRVISDCHVLLVLIDDKLLEAKDNAGRGLGDKGDRQTEEIEFALHREMPVFPVLIDDATMPEPEELPASLQDLYDIQAASIPIASVDAYGVDAHVEPLADEIRRATEPRDSSAGPSASGPRTFVSYRRADTAEMSIDIYKRLKKVFDAESVFQDVNGIRPGRPWGKVIEEAIGSCQVLLVLIGDKWLSAEDKRGRRLDHDEDQHRKEIEVALGRGISVLPVLVEDAPMPRPEELPESLRSLPDRGGGWTIHKDTLDRDVDQLAEVIERAAKSVTDLLQESSPASREASVLTQEPPAVLSEPSAAPGPTSMVDTTVDIRTFISYRSDVAEVSRPIYAYLARELGSVFRDVNELVPGRPWRRVMDDAIGSCDVLVVLIGDQWLEAKDLENQERRLDDPEDRQRQEIEIALRRDIPVLPVLIDEAGMPLPEELPESLRPLCDYQVGHIRERTLPYDVQELAEVIKRAARRHASGFSSELPPKPSVAPPEPPVPAPEPPVPPGTVEPAVRGDFAVAEELLGLNGSARGDNVGTRKEPGEPDHASNPGGRSVWYRWPASADGTAVVDTFGSSFDTLLAVYRGSRLDRLELVAENDDAQEGRQSRVSFPVAGGVEYRIAVDGYGGAVGDITLNWDLHPAPPNDHFDAPLLLSGSRGATSGDSRAAGKEPGEPDHAGNGGGRSVWYRWTAPEEGNAVIDTFGSSFDTLLAVYRGSQLDELELVAANDDTQGRQSRVSFPVAEGEEYRIAVDGFGGDAGEITLNWAVHTGLPNDDFDSPEVIRSPSGTTIGDSTGASKEPGEPNHAGNEGGRSVWYRWTVPAEGMAVIDTFGSRFDTLLAVYRGSQVDDLAVVAENDDAEGSRQSRVKFPVAEGEEYRIAVDGYGGEAGAITLNWAVIAGPPNDDFDSPEAISGSSGRIFGDTSAAGKVPGEPNHAGNAGGRSVWYRWTAPAGGTATIDTFGSSFDTLLAVYQGSRLSALEAVASNDDTDGRQSRVQFRVVQGREYRIAVDGFAGAGGAVVLNWAVRGPTIRQQAIMTMFRLVGLAVGVLAGIYVYNNEEPDWGLAALTVVVVAGFLGWGLGAVFTHDKKIRRTLYFAVIAASRIGVAYGAYELWDEWWLAAVLGIPAGWVIGMPIARLLFKDISREQIAEALS